MATTRLFSFIFLFLPLAGCSTYSQFDGEVVNNDTEAHSYEVHVTYSRYGETKRTWNETVVVEAMAARSLGSFGSREGGYTIQVTIDGNATAFGQTTFQRDEGPGGFTVTTSSGADAHEVTYWHH